MNTNIQTPTINPHSIIACVNDSGETKFLSEDRSCGEYYWSEFLDSATMFSCSDANYSTEVMDKLLKQIRENKSSPTMDGTIFPSRLVHSGAGLDNDKTKGFIRVFKIDVKLVKIVVNVSNSFTVDAEIVKPTGHTY